MGVKVSAFFYAEKYCVCFFELILNITTTIRIAFRQFSVVVVK